MGLLIKNGNIVTSDQNFVADIWCEEELITAIGKDLPTPPNAEVIDATGKYVFPGFIDPHVHIYLPFMGAFAKDDYQSASRAALAGGTTTVIEMICPAKSDEPLAAYATWRDNAEGQSACDYTFHMGISRFDEAIEGQLRQIVSDGITSFKVFLAYKDAFGIDDTELYQTLRLAQRLGVVVAAHCENEALIDQLQKDLLAAGDTGPGAHERSRPEVVEAEGVNHLMTFAEITRAQVYIVHLSCEKALQAALAARSRGVNVSVETLIQYLLLDKTDAERPDFEGAKYVMSPPLRDKRNQSTLWNAICQGQIATVATDHAPFDFAGQKEMGRDNFTLIPNGIPSLEERVKLLFSHGVAAGKLDLNRFVEVASTQAAKLFGLFPRKGTIQLGADADLVVYDPNHQGVITAKEQQSAVDYSAFEGWAVQGRPEIVSVRGQIQIRDGEFVGTIGRGQLLRRNVRS